MSVSGPRPNNPLGPSAPVVSAGRRPNNPPASSVGVTPGPGGGYGSTRPDFSRGPYITFAVMYDSDEHFSQYVTIRTRAGDTVAKICARRGQPEMVFTVASLNHIRHVHRVLPAHTRLKLPGVMRQSDVISILADDPPPLIKDGYAILDTVAVPGRRGLTRFVGYNPWVLDIPIQWESWTDQGRANQNEWEIWTLQRMAGRSTLSGAGQGPPPVIRVSVTGPNGRVVPLLPHDLQWFPPSGYAPLWRISGIQWDPNPIRQGLGHVDAGRRLRQKCVVTVQQYTPLTIPEASASQRSRARNQTASHQ